MSEFNVAEARRLSNERHFPKVEFDRLINAIKDSCRYGHTECNVCVSVSTKDGKALEAALRERGFQAEFCEGGAFESYYTYFIIKW